MFKDSRFAVLGLGDTNYDKFCHMGKSIDKRLSELGGQRVLPLRCADEATNLEETVEEWKVQIFEQVKSFIFEISPSAEEKVGNPTIESLHDNCKISSTKFSESDRKFDDSSLTTSEVEVSLARASITSSLAEEARSLIHQRLNSIPLGILDMEQVASSVNLYEKLADLIKSCTALMDSTSVTKNSSHKIVQFSPQSPMNTEANDGNRPSSYEYFSSDIIVAKWLTSEKESKASLKESLSEWGNTKRVVSCELSLENSKITYLPGDSIGICCPNPPYAVDIVLKRLQTLEPSLSISSRLNIIEGENVETVTLEELLSYRLDLTGIPKKASIQGLAKCCTSEHEHKLLFILSGKTPASKLLWQNFVENQGLGLAEILFLFPTCKPTLTQLANIATSLPPRYYSVASSPLLSSDRVRIAFSLVRNKFSIGQTSISPIQRSGVCTLFMESLLSSWLYGAQTSPLSPDETKTIRIFHKSTPSFHLPGSVNIPLILIGPGTGVAPFMGFLQHRSILEQERQKTGGDSISSGVWRGAFDLDEINLPCEANNVNRYIQSVAPGVIQLYFGCRTPQDFLFEAELKDYCRQGTLTTLEVAMSRVSVDSCYVTKKLLDRSNELASLILKDEAHIYICGDGNKMAKDVQLAILDILVKQGNLPNAAAEEYLTLLRQKRRLVLDIWS